MTKKAEEQREIERFYAAEFKMGYMASEECESKKEGSLQKQKRQEKRLFPRASRKMRPDNSFKDL